MPIWRMQMKTITRTRMLLQIVMSTQNLQPITVHIQTTTIIINMPAITLTMAVMIILRQQSMKTGIEMEVVAAVNSLTLKTCRNCIEDKTAHDEAHTAAL